MGQYYPLSLPLGCVPPVGRTFQCGHIANLWPTFPAEQRRGEKGGIIIHICRNMSHISVMTPRRRPSLPSSPYWHNLLFPPSTFPISLSRYCLFVQLPSSPPLRFLTFPFSSFPFLILTYITNGFIPLLLLEYIAGLSQFRFGFSSFFEKYRCDSSQPGILLDVTAAPMNSEKDTHIPFSAM